MKRILSAVLCILLMFSCAFCEAPDDPIAGNAPYEEGKWASLGGGYEVYLPEEFELEENYAFYTLYGNWFDMSMSTYCALKVTRGSKTYASLEEVCQAYAMLRAEIVEINGVRLVDKMKNVAEAQGANVVVWELLCDDGTTLAVEFEMKNDTGEIEEDTQLMFDYILTTLRKAE